MPSIPIIESHLDSLLELIKRFGAKPSFANEARDNVRMQICSLLAHWSDVEFRNTLLVIGREEGDYYKPYSAVNPFVVVTIRNSMLENLHSVNHLQTGLKRNIGPDEIKRITQQAIRHFGNVNFDELARTVNISADADCYGGLPEKYPIAWEALRQLGNSREQVISYQPVTQSEELLLAGTKSLSPAQERANSRTRTVLDGYSNGIEPALQAYLDDVQNAELDCMCFDSFKMLTRNIDKLMRVLNHVLACNGEFVTANCFITNGYIEQRSIYLPPTNSHADPYNIRRIRQIVSGDIGNVHKEALKSMLT